MLGQHLRHCVNGGTREEMSWEVIDQADTNVKLLTIDPEEEIEN